LPWYIVGDYNVTRFPSERLCKACLCPAIVEFYDFSFDQGLMDLPLVGGAFTWSNNQSWSRINRFLVSSEWEAEFLGVSQRSLPRLCLDHFPILLDCGDLHRGSRSFKFENIWLKSERFMDRVKQWW
jgi:hypothetical protein